MKNDDTKIFDFMSPIWIKNRHKNRTYGNGTNLTLPFPKPNGKEMQIDFSKGTERSGNPFQRNARGNVPMIFFNIFEIFK